MLKMKDDMIKESAQFFEFLRKWSHFITKHLKRPICGVWI